MRAGGEVAVLPCLNMLRLIDNYFSAIISYLHTRGQ
jgi:hypothetical protein